MICVRILVAAWLLGLWPTAGHAEESVGQQAEQSRGDSTATNSRIRWVMGKSGCDDFYLDGARFKSIETSQAYIAAKLQDTGSKLRADIYVRNIGTRRIDVFPDSARLWIGMPVTKILSYESPYDLARSMRRKASWATFFGAVGAALQTQTTRSNTQGRIGGSNFESTTETVTPNYAAQQRAYESAIRRSEGVQDAQSYLDAIALRANTVGPGADLYGAVFFDRASHPEQVLLSVTLGDVRYELPFGKGWEPGVDTLLAKPTRPASRTGATPAESSAVLTPVVIHLTNGKILQAKRLEPWGMGNVKATLTNGEVRFLSSPEIRRIVDATGIDRTKLVLIEGKRFPRTK